MNYLVSLQEKNTMSQFSITKQGYETMKYRRCGKSGLLLSEIALGFWHNFGSDADDEKCRAIVNYAFDKGITYFDLANNYGPVAGSAEQRFGQIYQKDLHTHRDEIIVASKAGHDMWPGPYGEWGSRKSLMASIDQSLKRLKMDYVDIFYSHRPDPNTPVEETMEALVDMVRMGKALYVGISKYPDDMAQKAYDYLKSRHTPCLVYQGKYNMIEKSPEEKILPQCKENGVGYVAFSPLAQGLLTGKYLNGIPENSRMSSSSPFLTSAALTPQIQEKIKQWNEEAKEQDMTMSQYALQWILRREEVTSVIVGASSVEQLANNIGNYR